MGFSAALPLAGRRLLVTRPRSEDRSPDPLVQALTALGAEVLWLPALTIAPPADLGPLDRALGSLSRFDWLLFTSQHAVSAVVARAAALGLVWADRPQAAAVGEATARALARAAGRREVVIALQPQASALAERLAPLAPGKRFLWPRAEQAAGDLAGALRAAGAAEVVAVSAYRAIATPGEGGAIRAALLAGQLDAALFSSGRAIAATIEAVGPDAAAALERLPKICLGPITARACRALGLGEPRLCAEASLEGLVAATVALFQESAA